MNQEALLVGLGDVLRDIKTDFSARLNQADERTKTALTEILEALKGVQEHHATAILALGEQIDVVRENSGTEARTEEQIESLRAVFKGLHSQVLNLAEKLVASDLQVDGIGRLVDEAAMKLAEQNSTVEILEQRVEQDVDALLEELAQSRAREKAVEKRVVDLERDLETVSAGAHARVDGVAQEARSAAVALETRLEQQAQAQEEKVDARVGGLKNDVESLVVGLETNLGRDLEAVSAGAHARVDDVAQEARAAVAALEQKQENLLERLVELTGLQDRAVEERWEIKEEVAKEIEELNRSLTEVQEDLEEAHVKVAEELGEVKSHLEDTSTKTSAMVAGILARADSQDDRIAQAEQTIAEKFQQAIEVNGHGWSDAKTYVEDIAYPWKTIVKYQGGLWQATRDTEDQPGVSDDWALLVEGIADIQFRLVDTKTGAVHIEIVRTSGERVRQEITWPQPRYLGTWKEDEDYELYDSVVEDGHRWLAVVSDPKGKPSKNRDAWVLFGMRGPAGRKGAPGAEGPEGRPGRSPSIEKIIETWMQTIQEAGGTPIASFRGLWEFGAEARRGDVFAFKDNLYLSLESQTCDMPPDAPGGMTSWIAMLFQTGGGGGGNGNGGVPPEDSGKLKVTTSDASLGFLNDKVQSGDGSVLFSVINPGGNEILDLQATGAGGGESNAGQNVGGGFEVYRDKTGVLINLRTLVNTARVSWTQNADTLEATVPDGVFPEEAPDDGNPKLRQTDTGVSTWVASGDAATRNVGTLAGTVAAGNDFRFLSTAQKTDLTDGGESTAHYHASDRARANHTGTQTLSTISDAGNSASRNIGTSAGTVAAGDDARFLSTVQKTDLTDGGESSLHYHDSDRARANHTGSQTLSTISDAGTAAAEDVGVTIGDVVQLENIGGNPGLPAVDGSQLTGLPGGGSNLHADLIDTATDGHPGTVINIPAGVQGNAVSIAADGTLQDSGTPPGGSGTTNLSNTPSASEVTVESSSGSDTSIVAATNALAGVMSAAQVTTLENAAAADDARFPTVDEKAAMTASTSPSGTNEFVTQSVLDAAIAALESAGRLLPATANERDTLTYTGGQWVASGVLDGGGA